MSSLTPVPQALSTVDELPIPYELFNIIGDNTASIAISRGRNTEYRKARAGDSSVRW